MFNESNFTIAISTARDGIYNVEKVICELIELKPEVLVCHQLIDGEDNAGYIKFRNELSVKYKFIKFFIDSGKGLSRSRNFLISNATKDYIFISDDDNVFSKQGVNDVVSFMRRTATNIAIARIRSAEGVDFKNYDKHPAEVTLKNSGSISSLEMCLERSVVNELYLFDEKFGLGTEYPSCEEFIFVTDALKRKLNIQRTNSYINVHPLESSGKDFSNKKLNRAKGAAFARVFGVKGVVLVIAFVFKKCFFEKTNLKFFRTMLVNQLAGYFSFFK